MTKKKGEFTVLRNIRAGMVIILLIYIGLTDQLKLHATARIMCWIRQINMNLQM